MKMPKRLQEINYTPVTEESVKKAHTSYLETMKRSLEITIKIVSKHRTDEIWFHKRELFLINNELINRGKNNGTV